MKESECTNYFTIWDQGQQSYEGKEKLNWKYEVLRIRIWRMEVGVTASMMESSALCHRMTHNFARDSFFNKDHMKKLCLARRRLHSKERRLNEQRDHLSFPERYMLIRMIYPIRIDRFHVMESNYWDDLMPSRNIWRSISLDRANQSAEIAGIGWGWYIGTDPSFRALQGAPCEALCRFRVCIALLHYLA